MHWRNKAKITKAISFLPYNEEIYKFVQKSFGRLKANPMKRITVQVEMARMLLRNAREIEGKTFFEVGSGHSFIVPIWFFLAGAKQVITYDLNRRLDLHIFSESLMWIVNNSNSLSTIFSDLTNQNQFMERLKLIDRLKKTPLKLLSEANIEYSAPADASKTNLNDSVIDYHISTTVFEHIPKDTLYSIMREAKRILKKGGAALHFIDPSDHFNQQDPSISKINFLKFSDKEWMNIAGNQFAYCNRLRASDFIELFTSIGFNIIEKLSLTWDPLLTVFEH